MTMHAATAIGHVDRESYANFQSDHTFTIRVAYTCTCQSNFKALKAKNNHQNWIALFYVTMKYHNGIQKCKVQVLVQWQS